jgi:hypothetical protein
MLELIEEELLELELLLELMLEEMLDETLDERLELTELERMLEENELLLELDVLVYLGMEHSFLPPGTLVPIPNVLSRQTKPPLSSL